MSQEWQVQDQNIGLGLPLPIFASWCCVVAFLCGVNRFCGAVTRSECFGSFVTGISPFPTKQLDNHHDIAAEVFSRNCRQRGSRCDTLPGMGI